MLVQSTGGVDSVNLFDSVPRNWSVWSSRPERSGSQRQSTLFFIPEIQAIVVAFLTSLKPGRPGLLGILTIEISRGSCHACRTLRSRADCQAGRAQGLIGDDDPCFTSSRPSLVPFSDRRY